MHPVIRVSLFLVFAISVSQVDLSQLAPAILVLFLFFVARARIRWRMALQMLKRLRWFFITILLLYGWLTPGQALFSNSLSILSGLTIDGVLAGLIQIASLVLMILALVALVSSLPTEVLLGAIYWWSYPLKLLRLSRESIVLRLMLTMETVELLQQQISDYANQSSATNRWPRLVEITGFAFKQVCKQAEQEQPRQVVIHCLASPPVWQWSYPIVVAALFQASQYLHLFADLQW